MAPHRRSHQCRSGPAPPPHPRRVSRTVSTSSVGFKALSTHALCSSVASMDTRHLAGTRNRSPRDAATFVNASALRTIGTVTGWPCGGVMDSLAPVTRTVRSGRGPSDATWRRRGRGLSCESIVGSTSIGSILCSRMYSGSSGVRSASVSLAPGVREGVVAEFRLELDAFGLGSSVITRCYSLPQLRRHPLAEPPSSPYGPSTLL